MVNKALAKLEVATFVEVETGASNNLRSLRYRGYTNYWEGDPLGGVSKRLRFSRAYILIML